MGNLWKNRKCYNLFMNRAVIFDMDGVIVKSEQLWNAYEPEYLRSIVGTSVADQIIGKTRGLAESQIFRLAQELGHTGTKQAFYDGYDVLAQEVYRKGPITPGIDDLIGLLASSGVGLGLVSSSPRTWIQIVIDRLKHGNSFTFVESVNDHPELKPKPSPDGYIAAMKALSSSTKETLIIEDSQTGINAAIASGAHVCGFALHVETDLPHGADVYAHTMDELQSACVKFAETGRL